MTEILNLDLKPWKTAGNLGNTGATGATAVYSKTVIADTLAEWKIGPDPTNPTAYQNGYWYFELGAKDEATRFEYEFDLWVPAAAKPQAIEFELQQQINGQVFNYALQANYGARIWRKFNFGVAPAGVEKWVSTGLAFNGFVPDSWHHIKAEFARTLALQTKHVALTVDGVTTSLEIMRDAYNAEPAKYATDKFNVGFQLDMNPTNGAYSVFTKGLTIRYE